MEMFTIKNPYSNSLSQVFITKSTYSNGRTALGLVDALDGIPYTTATTNLPEVLLADNEVLIKDYSENEGVLDFLVENNIVIPTKRGIQSGYEWIPVCILLPEDQWGKMYPPAEQINPDNGLGMWTIDGYRIWANNYKEAMNLLPLIESF